MAGPLDDAELCAGGAVGEDSAVLRRDQDVRVAGHDLRRDLQLLGFTQLVCVRHYDLDILYILL